MQSLPYLPGIPPPRNEVLARYLPPAPQGVLEGWLRSNVPIQADEAMHPWILDPFGASPRLVVEAARAGYRVLVAANNPVARFLIEMAASPPGIETLRAALAALASARRGDERLELHLQSLYTTTCECGDSVMAEAFIWERTTPPGAPPESRLIGRIYHCAACGRSGERATTADDDARAAQFAGGGLHRARALERVAHRDDPNRSHVEEALDVYLPRAVYALFTLINRLDGMALPAPQRDALTALLLHACDQANTLWPYPGGRARPRQLTIPPRFRENNVWLALEQALEVWASAGETVHLARWPELPPPTGGICLFEGRSKDLTEWLQTVPISVVAAALPRPNQAFWTLSALWSGWLWGQDAVGPFKSVLRRRRYDWSWHGTALLAALDSLAPNIPEGTPFWGLVSEAEPGFLSAAIIAAAQAGFDLSGIAHRPDSSQAQIVWHRKSIPASPDPLPDPILICRNAAKEVLSQRNQPATYLHLHTAALANLTKEGLFQAGYTNIADSVSRVNGWMEDACSFRAGFLRFGGSEKSLETGLWWHKDLQPAHPPLADRVEIYLVNQLLKNSGITRQAIDTAACAEFPGSLTPSAELVHLILDSYAEEIPPSGDKFQIRQLDQPKARRQDIEEITALLEQIGKQLGYQVEDDSPQVWKNTKGETELVCHVIASAVVGNLLLRTSHPAVPSYIAIPGSRANLMAFKLQRDPRIRLALENGWHVIKYRQVRFLAQNPALSSSGLEIILSDDNLTYDAPQLRML
jgi:hypothetical protein